MGAWTNRNVSAASELVGGVRKVRIVVSQARVLVSMMGVTRDQTTI
jgi:hypothetical protein